MLRGIRIIEIEALGPAPFAAMMLADLGSEVICIHRKGTAAPPGMPERSILDRGKKSIALDLKNAQNLQIAQELIATADGLIEGFRPGVMERLGLGPTQMHQKNPKLVYGRMTGWGQQSPRATQAGHDLNYIALSGALWSASAPNDTPLTPPTLVGDIGGGALYLVAGLLAGLLRAAQTGVGTVVDAAIYDGSAHMMNLLMALRQAGGFGEVRGENLLTVRIGAEPISAKVEDISQSSVLSPNSTPSSLRNWALATILISFANSTKHSGLSSQPACQAALQNTRANTGQTCSTTVTPA